MASPSRTSNHTYLRNRAHAYKTTDTCWLCGHWIDYTLAWPDPYSASGDHVIPLSRGGHIHGEIRAAHLVCNKRRGRRMPPVPHGRDW